jgi:hypothetical protein
LHEIGAQLARNIFKRVREDHPDTAECFSAREKQEYEKLQTDVANGNGFSVAGPFLEPLDQSCVHPNFPSVQARGTMRIRGQQPEELVKNAFTEDVFDKASLDKRREDNPSLIALKVGGGQYRLPAETSPWANLHVHDGLAKIMYDEENNSMVLLAGARVSKGEELFCLPNACIETPAFPAAPQFGQTEAMQMMCTSFYAADGNGAYEACREEWDSNFARCTCGGFLNCEDTGTICEECTCDSSDCGEGALQTFLQVCNSCPAPFPFYIAPPPPKAAKTADALE